MKSFAVVAPFVSALAVSLALLAPGEAAACGMSVRLAPIEPQQNVKPSPVMEVAAAEKALDQNQPLIAARKILGSFPTVRAEEAGKDPLRTRALRVFALAAVRADGGLALGGNQTWTRTANLEWAVQALREIDQKRPNDPALQADLGEALAMLPHTTAEAFGLLDGLAQKDLMGSPSAYAALSHLRAEKGDANGATVAMKRCEGMAQTPAVCVQPAKTAAVVPVAPLHMTMLASRQ